MAFVLTELGQTAFRTWCMRVLSDPEVARIAFGKPTASAPVQTLSVHGCASLFDFFLAYAANAKPAPAAAECFQQIAREISGTRSFAAFLSANAGLFFRRGLVTTTGDPPNPDCPALHGRFFIPSWCAEQWCATRTPAIAVAYNDGTTQTASWYVGAYDPVSGTVAFEDGTTETLDRRRDEYVVGEAVEWVVAHPNAIFFRADGIPFLYSNQGADMAEFGVDLRFLVEKMGLCCSVDLPKCAAGTTVRAYVESPAVNFKLC